jgi:hypothetical protein
VVFTLVGGFSLNVKYAKKQARDALSNKGSIIEKFVSNVFGVMPENMRKKS